MDRHIKVAEPHERGAEHPSSYECDCAAFVVNDPLNDATVADLAKESMRVRGRSA